MDLPIGKNNLTSYWLHSFTNGKQTEILKGLSYEIDLKNLDEN
jgi:hypothetical protein